MSNPVSVSVQFGGKEIIIETGKLAKQAGGSAVIRCGDTVVLVAATAAVSPKEGIDFFPLVCDFEEKLTVSFSSTPSQNKTLFTSNPFAFIFL